MFGKNRLALDMLVVTACCVVWVVLMTGAEDGDGANPAPPAAGTASTDETQGGAELPLFLESGTTAAQTKPDNPEAVLKSGVTVASSSAAVNRKVADPLPPLGGRGVDSAPASLRSRQAGLSLDGSNETLAVERPATAGSGGSSRRLNDAGPVLEVFAADKTERIDTAKPLAESSATTKAPVQKLPAAKPAGNKPVSSLPARPAASRPKQQLAARPAVPKSAPQPPSAALTSELPAADLAAPLSNSEQPDAATSTSLREHFTESGADGAGDSLVLPAGEELAIPQTEASVETEDTSAPAIISGRLPQTSEAANTAPSLAQAFRNGSVGSQVPAVRPLNIGLMLAAMAGLIALAVWLRGGNGRNPFALLKQKSVNVIETISIAPGRQIILVELRGSALVLGVTPQSINLLDKVPLELLEENYQPTVQEIIHREGAARADWAARPKVAAMGGGSPVGPRTVPSLHSSYGPPPQGRMSVAELRQQRAGGHGYHSYRGTGSVRPPRLGELRVTPRQGSLPSGAETPRLGKAELLDNLREQLRNREQ